MEFSRQEGWSGLPLPPPGDLLCPGIEPASPASAALAGRLFTTVLSGEPEGLLLLRIKVLQFFKNKTSSVLRQS